MEMPTRDKILTTALTLYVFSQILFLLFVQFPKGYHCEEFHYVPSAKQFLTLVENQNWEHPPLGKEIMAIGIGIGGDRPFGWRLMSTVFGALTLVGMYFWGLAVFRNQRNALYVALLTVFNQLLYIQARAGMLDTFMMAFLTWGLAAFCAAWDRERTPKEMKRLHAFAGLMFGLATATKWTSMVAWFSCILLILGVLLLQKWGVRFSTQNSPPSEDWYSPKLWKGLGLKHWGLCFLIIPLLAYFATFIPFLFIHRTPAYGLWDLLMMQPRMLDGQLRVVSDHPYMSRWLSWPWMARPIWYSFEKEGPSQEWAHGVLMLGNPLIMWAGVLAVIACMAHWLETRSRETFLIVATYCFFFFCWAVIPRKVSFYYYYYPAGMTLSLALTFVFDWLEKTAQSEPARWGRWLFLAISGGLFIYFFPIISGIRIPADSFRNWMWFGSWI